MFEKEHAAGRRPPGANDRNYVLAATVIATFMAAVESTIVATAMPTIVADLGDFHLFSWVFAAYLLTQAVSIPIYGRLADLYGRKRMFFIGAGLFLIGSALCGFARGMLSLIVFRAIQGVGAGAVQPIATTIVADIYTPTERARVQGLLSSAFGVAAIIGPTLGGLLVERLNWSFVFWINLPVGALAIAMLAVFFRETVRSRPHRIDYLGSLLLMLGGGALMMALVQVGNMSFWTLAACTTIGLLSLGALLLHEMKVSEPILPLDLWRDSMISFCNVGSLGMGIIVISVSGFLPTYIQGVMGYSPAVAGITFGSSSVSWAIASFIAGRVIIQKSYRISAMIGSTAIVAGSVVLIAMTPTSGALWAGAGASIVGTGLGFCNTTYLVAVQAAAMTHERGAATSSNMFMRIVGQSVGAALFGAVVNIGITLYDPGLNQIVEKLMDPALRSNLGEAQLMQSASVLASALRNIYIVDALIGIALILLGSKLSPHAASDGQWKGD